MALPVKSGKEVLQALYRAREAFGLTYKRIKGSHAKMHRKPCHNFSVPLHEELKSGTLLNVIADAGMTKDEFLRYDP